MVLTPEGTGHEVIAATTGTELVRRLGQRTPDIVISDYRLASGETGFDVVEAVRAVFGDALPALITTGAIGPAVIRSMASSGISIDCKPLRLESLQRSISLTAEGYLV